MELSLMHQWGLDVIAFVQQMATPLLTTIFKAITVLGNESFFVMCLPVIWSQWDRDKSTRLSVCLLVGAFLNFVLKDWIAHPRPCFFDPYLCLIEITGYGLPSGHAQISVLFWGVLAAEWGKKEFQQIVWGLIFLIGFSRIYLGVHFPTDVLAGWLVGGILFFVYRRYGAPLGRWVSRLSSKTLFLLILIGPLCLAVINHSKGAISVLSAFTGLMLSMVWTRSWGIRAPQVSMRARYLRGGLAFAGTMVLYLGLKSLFDSIESGAWYFRVIRYFIVGWWIAMGAEFVSRQLGWGKVAISSQSQKNN